MQDATSNHTRILGAIALLVLAGWGWALSNVGMPDTAWLVNAGLTIVLLVLLVIVAVRRLQRG